MANDEHIALVRNGARSLNEWRRENPDVALDLIEADLAGLDLIAANLSKARMRGVILREARLVGASLNGADLSQAHLDAAHLKDADLFRARLPQASLVGANLCRSGINEADLRQADLTRANLNGAIMTRSDLSGANLNETDLIEAKLYQAQLVESNLVETRLTRADLRGANLTRADMRVANLIEANLAGAQLCGADLTASNLLRADLTDADLTGCRVYGISAWRLHLDDTKQRNLIITARNEPDITVDDIEVAQFVYLLLHNEKIRSVIDTIGNKGVLILGRFTNDRKPVLEAIRSKLRELGFVPMMFDFEKPTQRDFTETIKTLAGLSKFIIADISNPKSSPLELQATMPDYMIPFVPIIHESEEPFSMFRDLKQKYGEWVLDLLVYDSTDTLVQALPDAIVAPALNAADRLLRTKSDPLRKRHVRDYTTTERNIG
ncbi:MAG: pentapeptide repeat-containing protein [Verrucomicrobiales bacterium]|nr:pentapeptide repeat-containing protein [Verrucomicrobiales bacterium]